MTRSLLLDALTLWFLYLRSCEPPKQPDLLPAELVIDLILVVLATVQMLRTYRARGLWLHMKQKLSG